MRRKRWFHTSLSFIEKREEGLTGAGRGTAYHRVFECLDFSKAGSVQEVEEQLASLESGHRIAREVRRTVSPRDVYQFAVSSIGKRMAKAQTAGMLYRGTAFCHGDFCRPAARRVCWG